MPMIDASIPQNALTPEAERRLLEEVTEILVQYEGFDPTRQRPRDATWIFVQRPEVFVAGNHPARPRYRFITCVPEGQLEDDARAAVVREVTAAVARAEGGSVEEVSKRVRVFPLEIQDGRWGALGEIQRLPDILAQLIGEHARPLGEYRLAIRRQRVSAVASSARDLPDLK